LSLRRGTSHKKKNRRRQPIASREPEGAREVVPLKINHQKIHTVLGGNFWKCKGRKEGLRRNLQRRSNTDEKTAATTGQGSFHSHRGKGFLRERHWWGDPNVPLSSDDKQNRTSFPTGKVRLRGKKKRAEKIERFREDLPKKAKRSTEANVAARGQQRTVRETNQPRNYLARTHRRAMQAPRRVVRKGGG